MHQRRYIVWQPTRTGTRTRLHHWDCAAQPAVSRVFFGNCGSDLFEHVPYADGNLRTSMPTKHQVPAVKFVKPDWLVLFWLIGSEKQLVTTMHLQASLRWADWIRLFGSILDTPKDGSRNRLGSICLHYPGSFELQEQSGSISQVDSLPILRPLPICSNIFIPPAPNEFQSIVVLDRRHIIHALTPFVMLKIRRLPMRRSGLKVERSPQHHWCLVVRASITSVRLLMCATSKHAPRVPHTCAVCDFLRMLVRPAPCKHIQRNIEMDLLLFRIQVQRDTLCVVCDFGLGGVVIVLVMPWKVIQHRKESLQVPYDGTGPLRQNCHVKDPKSGYCYGSMLELGICWVWCPVTGESDTANCEKHEPAWNLPLGAQRKTKTRSETSNTANPFQHAIETEPYTLRCPRQSLPSFCGSFSSSSVFTYDAASKVLSTLHGHACAACSANTTRKIGNTMAGNIREKSFKIIMDDHVDDIVPVTVQLWNLEDGSREMLTFQNCFIQLQDTRTVAISRIAH